MSGSSMPVSLILHILGLSIGAVLYVLLARLALRALAIVRSAGESTGQQTILLLIASVGGLLSLALTGVDVWQWQDQPRSVGAELATHYALLPLIVALLYVHRASQRETQARQLAAVREELPLRDASILVRSVPGVGTTAELRVPRRVA